MKISVFSFTTNRRVRGAAVVGDRFPAVLVVFGQSRHENFNRAVLSVTTWRGVGDNSRRVEEIPFPPPSLKSIAGKLRKSENRWSLCLA